MTGNTENQPKSLAVRRRVLILGATGTIGRAAVYTLSSLGHEVISVVRPGSAGTSNVPSKQAGLRFSDVTNPASLAREGFRGEKFDVVVSCLASRTGVPRDAWAIDHRANINALSAAKDAGVSQFILLSAICVQKPLLEFQRAKLAFEKALTDSGIPFSIVRPTAFFKSLSGQVERVRKGKPFLLFGDGELTSCKPVSDRDLAEYIAGCIGNPERLNRVLPIGGPGPAITPRQQGEKLFQLLGKEPKFRRVPVAMLTGIAGTLGAVGKFHTSLADKAELARIGRYYATESMLVLNPATGRYDADATPSTGRDTLFDYYERLVSGEEKAERGEHAVF